MQLSLVTSKATAKFEEDQKATFNAKRPSLSVVTPCFNEEDSISNLYARVTNVCRRTVGSSYELILVNDGSRDSTWARMVALTAEDHHVVAVNLSRNYGHQIALTAGLRLCRGKRILILDADLQDPPELLDAMMERMDEGFDVVYGQRLERLGESALKRATATAFYRLLRHLVDIEIPLDTGDFRLLSRRALDLLNQMPERHRFIRGMVSWIGFRQVGVPYVRAPRHAGTTNYPLSKMLCLAFDAITGFSVKPLRLASWLGLCTGLGGLIVILYVLGSWMTGRVIEGWTSLMVVTLVIGSSQLLMIGLLGEYLGRLYVESKGRPLFVIDSIVSPGGAAAPFVDPEDTGAELDTREAANA